MIFHSFLYVYQRVNHHSQSPLNHHFVGKITTFQPPWPHFPCLWQFPSRSLQRFKLRDAEVAEPHGFSEAPSAAPHRGKSTGKVVGFEVFVWLNMAKWCFYRAVTHILKDLKMCLFFDSDLFPIVSIVLGAAYVPLGGNLMVRWVYPSGILIQMIQGYSVFMWHTKCHKNR